MHCFCYLRTSPLRFYNRTSGGPFFFISKTTTGPLDREEYDLVIKVARRSVGTVIGESLEESSYLGWSSNLS